jgi:hypothetical protein
MDKSIQIPPHLEALVEKVKGLDVGRLSAANTVVDYLHKTTKLPGRVILDLPSTFEVVDPTPIVPKRSLPQEPVLEGRLDESVHLGTVGTMDFDQSTQVRTASVRCPHCNTVLTIIG